MNIIQRFGNFIAGEKPKIEKRQSVVLSPDNSWTLQGDHLHYSLEDDQTSAACIDLIQTAIQTMKGTFHDDRNNAKFKELEDIINYPNIRETRFTLLYNLVRDYFYGNAFLRIHDNWSERLNPDLCVIDLARNAVIYQDNKYGTDKQIIPLQNIIHIPSRFGYDGVIGKSIFSTFKPVYTRTHNIDQFVEDRYNSNGNLSKRLVVDITDTVEAESEEKMSQFKRDFVNKYMGAKNSTLPLVKQNGMNFETLDTGIPTQTTSIELTDNRKFQVEEICRLFNVPKQMVDGSSGWTNEIYIAFIQNAVKPVQEEFAERLTKLLPLPERKKHYFEWDYASLERTNTTQQYTNIKDRLTYGIQTINEIRAELNQPLFKDELADQPMVVAGKLPLSYLLEKLKQEQEQQKQSQEKQKQAVANAEDFAKQQQTANLMLGNPTGGTNGSNSAEYHQDNPLQQDNMA